MGFTLKLEKDGNKWHAFCPELHGCHTFGPTKKEALKNLKDAILLYMEDEIDNESMKVVITVLESDKKKKSHV